MPQIGDAGAMIPPLFGDGISAALRSAGRCAHYGDKYLRNAMSMEEWYRAYRLDMQKEYASILSLGRRLQALANMPVVPRILHGLRTHVPSAGRCGGQVHPDGSANPAGKRG
ncbi:hypothetical protein VQ056_14085 [Paenibacillus sp. JTLBN-2024]